MHEHLESERHYHGLDTLRALAILMVIPWHARTAIPHPWLEFLGRHGWAGVDLFFVLSGFLIGSQLFRSLKKDGRASIAKFYLKRAFRILPAYWVVLALYLCWPAFREVDALDAPWRFLLFVSNIGIGRTSFSHAWSLCVEEHFYLLLPLLVWLWARARPRKIHPVFLIVAIFAGGLVLRYSIWSVKSSFGAKHWNFYKWLYYPTYCRLDGLTVGVSLALMRPFRATLWSRLTSRPLWLVSGGLALVGLGMAAFSGPKQLVASVFAFPLVSVGFGLLVAAALTPGFWLFERKLPGAALLSTAAYTLYLTHKQMIHLSVEIVPDPGAHAVLVIVLAIALVGFASAFLHFFVEKPGLVIRKAVMNAFEGHAATLPENAASPCQTSMPR